MAQALTRLDPNASDVSRRFAGSDSKDYERQAARGQVGLAGPAFPLADRHQVLADSQSPTPTGSSCTHSLARSTHASVRM